MENCRFLAQGKTVILKIINNLRLRVSVLTGKQYYPFFGPFCPLFSPFSAYSARFFAGTRIVKAPAHSFAS
jgi:hypothetical protein